MNKILAIICISILASPALLAADAKPAPTVLKSKPAGESAPVELKNKSAEEASPIALKNKSAFNVDAGTRSPFWPISWKPTGKVASGGTDQGEVPAGAFVVSTITLDGGARFAIINGKAGAAVECDGANHERASRNFTLIGSAAGNFSSGFPADWPKWTTRSGINVERRFIFECNGRSFFC